MRRLAPLIALGILGNLSTAAHAGLFYSGESYAELPSQWRGFLLDQRILRSIAVPPAFGTPPTSVRQHYQEEADKLFKGVNSGSGTPKLGADVLADLGAILVRLGEFGRAVEVLRSAQREYPTHYQIQANLGTAWQLHGDLEQAAFSLQQAARLAPEVSRPAEELQLKLVQLRLHQPKDFKGLDDLFGIRFVAENGQYEPGKLANDQRKKLPAEAVAALQQLALWLPGDGRLLWQLAELANAYGDVKTAAAIMDGCVSEFGMNDPDLRLHRHLSRSAANHLATNVSPLIPNARFAHESHGAWLRLRSRRPLLRQFDQAPLPRIIPSGINPLPWGVLAQTAMLERKFHPTFSAYLQELEGKQVMLTGFMQPLGDDLDLSSFMFIEYPIGCWYCEAPEVTGIVLVELANDKTTPFTRGQVKVIGTLHLNGSDPEDFLYTLKNARVSAID